MIDLNAIEKCANYSELPKTFVIFICTFDAFHKKLQKYTFQNICKEDSNVYLNHETYKIFFTTKGKKGNISQEAKNVLKFIANDTAEDNFTEKLAQEMQKIKKNKEWKVEYMTLLMCERKKYTEGREQGRAEGEIQGAVKACKDFNLSYQETIKYLMNKFNLSLQEVEESIKKNWI